MTDIPSIVEGVSLQELIRSSSVSEKDRRDKKFPKDPVEEATRPKSLDELVESRQKQRAEGQADDSASFEEQARKAAQADEVTRLVESLSRLDIEPQTPTGEPTRRPDVDPGSATFNEGPSLNDVANVEARERRDTLAGSFESRIDEQNAGIIRDSRVSRNIVGNEVDRQAALQDVRSELDDVSATNSRSEAVFDSRESVDSSTRSQGELADLSVREQGNPQDRLVSVEQSIGDLVASDDVDSFIGRNSQADRTSQEQALFGGQQIEEAISSNQAANTLRLLDEQQAVAVLKRGANSVVVGSDVVEGVDDDGRVTQTRLEQDSALRTPGAGLFFDSEADRDLGNILNGVG